MTERSLLLWAFLVCTLLLLVPLGFRMHGQFGLAVWNLGHLGIGAALAFALHRQSILQRPARQFHHWLMVLLLVMVIAAVFELLQKLVQRSASLDDIGITGVGALLCLWYIDPPRGWRPSARRALVIGTLLATMATFTPFFWFGAAMLQARLHLPVLADFESWWYRTQWSETAFVVGPGPESHGRVGWFNGQPSDPEGRLWRTVSFREFPGNWALATGLAMRIHSNQPTRLVLRLEDQYFRTKGDFQPEHRVRVDVSLREGWNEVSLTGDTWRITRSGRELDLSQMVAVHFTLPQLQPGLMLAFDDLRLLGTGSD